MFLILIENMEEAIEEPVRNQANFRSFKTSHIKIFL